VLSSTSLFLPSFSLINPLTSSCCQGSESAQLAGKLEDVVPIVGESLLVADEAASGAVFHSESLPSQRQVF